MKKLILIPSLVISLSLSLLANESKVIAEEGVVVEELAQEQQATELQSTPESLSSSNTVIRIGFLDGSGTHYAQYTDTATDEELDTPKYDLDESGFEVSLMFGLDENEGFDFRPGFTIQSTESENDLGGTVSNIALLAEFEFAYKINPYITPLVGFNAGIGMSSDDLDTEQEDLFALQGGLFVGVHGDIYNDFGYYVKYTLSKRAIVLNDIDDSNVEDAIDKQTVSPITFGLSYTF